ncbi:hypothetical protein MFFC18_40010 [Mariniblastus fucicola]|uniref:Uncharacterized protein n=1 Tax=Mariniblastus fucicola TaxID=980251 RepID=A0A5B9PFW0_9BACT|nr:hypothetical protein MFFC18_40010 [Mariniblastus fucicola]
MLGQPGFLYALTYINESIQEIGEVLYFVKAMAVSAVAYLVLSLIPVLMLRLVGFRFQRGSAAAKCA